MTLLAVFQSLEGSFPGTAVVAAMALTFTVRQRVAMSDAGQRGGIVRRRHHGSRDRFLLTSAT